MTLNSIEPAILGEELASTAPPQVIDLRTVAEFVRGRPAGAVVNIPWHFVHPATSTKPGALVPNASFLEVAICCCALERPLVVMCDDGQSRSPHAAIALRDAGFQHVKILSGGFAAWQANKLRATTDNRPGVSYVSLLMRAKRGAETAATAGH